MVAVSPAVGPLGEVICVTGRSFSLSSASGQIRPGQDHGVYRDDIRMLSTLVLTLDGVEPHPLGGYPIGSGAARFSACARHADITDPTLLIDRHRWITDTWRERIRVTNHGIDAVEVVVGIETAADFTYIFEVKHGHPPAPVSGIPTSHGLTFEQPLGSERTLLVVDPRSDEQVDAHLRWTVALPSQGAWQVELALAPDEIADSGEDTSSSTTGSRETGIGALAGSLARPLVTCSDVRFERLFDRSVADLDSLLAADGGDRYFAAGTPWFLTLFGRDSLWSASMGLLTGVEVASETLRLLARTQGARHDPITEEAPGKILHELRYGAQVDRGDLPPRYYGTIDATPLFVILLERAWRWGLDEASVAALLPHAERALEWMRDDGDHDGEGFLRYAASGDPRLANQGWKDSGDAISFADGHLAEAPIALCEVQGYAYRAALAGAALLDAFDHPGGDSWRRWAQRLRNRFQAAFWVDDADGGFPALALDGQGRQVDAVSSNAAHLLGTGILDPDQEARIAARLSAPDLDSGWGLRTLSSTSPRFNPLSYHGGSVWPHDTAIAIDGLAGIGAPGVAIAGHLLQGLIAAGEHLGYRLPELFGGEQRTPGSRPLPYPAACRPQAWSAGATLLALRAVFGIEPDVPAGVVRLRPMRPSPFSRLTLEDMPLAGGTLSLTLKDEQLTVTGSPPGLQVIVLGDEDGLGSARTG
ncbi:MAG: glycogen debranching N-terminal domain-containing protein [Nitriliruptoraceae bacterium]